MRYLPFFIFIFIFRMGFGQNKADLPFIEHLINKGYYNEVIQLTKIKPAYATKTQLDSLNFYKGWAYYSLKNLDLSTSSLLEVEHGSTFYLKSRFFAGYNQMYLGNYFAAEEILSDLKIKEETYVSLVNFELSGNYMLLEKWGKAKDQLQLVNTNIALVNQQVEVINQIIKAHEKHRHKNPVIAGIMSAIIPGSGKIYSGKTGEGIATMIATAGFGVITWENNRKLGFGNFKTILFGSIFAANYVSNIYGSVISVKLKKEEYQNALHNQILFQLHIPLRNFFE